jgi:hypothetical protein
MLGEAINCTSPSENKNRFIQVESFFQIVSRLFSFQTLISFCFKTNGLGRCRTVQKGFIEYLAEVVPVALLYKLEFNFKLKKKSNGYNYRTSPHSACYNINTIL